MGKEIHLMITAVRGTSRFGAYARGTIFMDDFDREMSLDAVGAAHSGIR